MKRIFFLWALVAVGYLYGNALNISNVAFDLSTKTVSFRVYWENSWRAGTGWPYNYDAVWIFVKFKPCNASPTLQWTHGLITNVSVTANPGSYASLEPVITVSNNPADIGTVVGIDPSPNNTGVMLRPTTTGSGTIDVNVVLTVSNLPAPGDSLEVRVFGLEMVYIPQGPFYIGDGPCPGSVVASRGAFHASTSSCPIQITSENAISICADHQFLPNGNWCGSADGWVQSCCNTVTDTFPKGYNAFFIMKYEITQGLWADFMNTNPVNTYTDNSGFYGSFRHTVTFAGSGYKADRPYRACAFISWDGFLAFCDWAALRPPTELQWEKAARGFGSTAEGQFAHGLNNRPVTGFSGPENGTEGPDAPEKNVIAGNISFTGGDGGQGPARVGLCAEPGEAGTDSTGASYFGVMDMSGNVAEWAIDYICGVSGNPCAQGVPLGDGYLNNNGKADVAGWPVDTNYHAAYRIIRGGAWSDSACRSTSTSYNNACVTSISARFEFVQPSDWQGKGVGGRAVR